MKHGNRRESRRDELVIVDAQPVCSSSVGAKCAGRTQEPKYRTETFRAYGAKKRCALSDYKDSAPAEFVSCQSVISYRQKSTVVALWFTFLFMLSANALAQSGAGGVRSSGREYGVYLTFAVYQFDDKRSQPMPELTHLTGTYSTAQDEIAYLEDKHRLEEIAVRHIRSVGLK